MNILIRNHKKKFFNGRQLFALFKMAEQKNVSEKNRAKLKNASLPLSALLLLLAIEIPFVEFICLYAKKDSRKKVWRQIAKMNLFLFLKITKIKINIEGFEKIDLTKPKIFICNHLFSFDSFILYYILGTRTVPMTAPIKYFKFPMSYWLGKMECIDVQRSDLESELYIESHNPHDAILQAAVELKKGNSVLIFPEGHVEYDSKLQYFHTGAARIALATGVNIVPIGIIDVYDSLVNDQLSMNAMVKINFGNEIDLHAYSKKNSLNIKEASRKLTESVVELLPNRYQPEDWKETEPGEISAIFTINGALFNGDAQVYLLMNLFKTGKISINHVCKAVIYYSLSRIGLISENNYLNKVNLLLMDYQAGDFYKLCKKLFEKKLKYRIFEKLKIIIKDHREKGHQIIILSSLLAPLTKCFADYIHANYWMATVPEEKGTKYTGKLLFCTYAENKAEALKKIARMAKFDLQKSHAYGHNEEDLLMLGLVRNKTLINPNVHIIKLLGSDSNFQILNI